MHTQNLELARQRLDALSHALDAVYVQLTPVIPYRDSADSAIRRSLDTRAIDRIERVPAAQALLNCDGCCRFPTPDDRLGRGREHSLTARLTEAMEISSLPASMRIDHAEQLLTQARHTLAAVNRSLRDSSEDELKVEYLDNHIAALRTMSARRSVA